MYPFFLCISPLACTLLSACVKHTLASELLYLLFPLLRIMLPQLPLSLPSCLYSNITLRARPVLPVTVYPLPCLFSFIELFFLHTKLTISSIDVLIIFLSTSPITMSAPRKQVRTLLYPQHMLVREQLWAHSMHPVNICGPNELISKMCFRKGVP